MYPGFRVRQAIFPNLFFFQFRTQVLNDLNSQHSRLGCSFSKCSRGHPGRDNRRPWRSTDATSELWRSRTTRTRNRSSHSGSSGQCRAATRTETSRRIHLKANIESIKMLSSKIEHRPTNTFAKTPGPDATGWTQSIKPPARPRLQQASEAPYRFKFHMKFHLKN